MVYSEAKCEWLNPGIVSLNTMFQCGTSSMKFYRNRRKKIINQDHFLKTLVETAGKFNYRPQTLSARV